MSEQRRGGSASHPIFPHFTGNSSNTGSYKPHTYSLTSSATMRHAISRLGAVLMAEKGRKRGGNGMAAVAVEEEEEEGFMAPLCVYYSLCYPGL